MTGNTTAMEPEKVQIIIGTKEDLSDLLELIQELAEFEKSPDSVINSEERMIAEWDHFNFVLARKGGKTLGMAVYFFSYSTWVGKSLYLDDLYVKEEYRGRGIGRRLLDHVLNLGWNEKCRRVRWQVLDWNEPAIAFYEKIGARISKEWYNCDMDQKALEEYLNQKAN